MVFPVAMDSSWVRRSFLLPADKLQAIDARNRFLTTASAKFYDTSPGAAICINPPPQFTRLADIKPKSIRRNGAPLLRESGLYGTVNYGTTMGRYYSEVIDDNAHVVHFRMGKTAFNSIFSYLSSFYSYRAAYVARTGRSPGFFYSLGKLAGMVVAVAAWPITAVIWIAKLAKFASGNPSTKYAFLKPTMPVYWACVQTMVNQVATYMGFNSLHGTVENLASPKEAMENEFYNNESRAAGANLHRILPDIFDEGGMINVYALATKAQRLATAHHNYISKRLDNIFGKGNLADAVVNAYSDNFEPPKPLGWQKILNAWQDKGVFGFFTESLAESGVDVRDNLVAEPGIDDYFKAEMQDGAAWVSFRVEEGGSISESFSNSAAETEIKNVIDQHTSAVRSKIQGWAGGNVANSITSTVGAALEPLKNFLGGLADSTGLGGITAILGTSYSDVPQHWEASSASMPRLQYTIKLNTPYNNMLSKMIHEIVPLCMLMAMGMPQSTGPQSYNAPFMLQVFDKGRGMVRYGMVDSITITRGTASTPFSQSRMYNGIEVSLSIMDLTTAMHMPITAAPTPGTTTSVAATFLGSLLGSGEQGQQEVADGVAKSVGAVNSLAAGISGDDGNGFFSDDTAFSDYMSTLASISLHDSIYSFPKFTKRLSIAMSNWRTHYSVPSTVSAVADTGLFNTFRMFYRDAEKTR